MKISGASSIPADPERAFRLLHDPAVLARCLPGCQGLEQTGPHEYEMQMKTTIGAVSARFSGKVSLAEQNFPNSFRMNVRAAGKIGFLDGGGLLTLTGDGDATSVAYDGEVRTGGTIAAVGQRLLATTAKIMIRRFFARFATEVSS